MKFTLALAFCQLLSILSVLGQGISANDSTNAHQLYQKAVEQLETDAYEQASMNFVEASNAFEKSGFWKRSAECLIELSAIQITRNKFEEANSTLKQVEKITRKELKDDPIIQARTLSKRASINEVYGNYQDALAGFRKALSLFKNVYGEQHKYVADTYTDISATFYYTSVIDSAFFYTRKSLKIHLALKGENSEGAALAYNRLGVLSRVQGNYDSAFYYMEKNLELLSVINGHKHKSLIQGYFNKGQIYLEIGNNNKAVDDFQKAMDISFVADAENLSRISSNHNNLAMAYLNLGNHELAFEHTNQALTLQKQIFSEKNVDIGISYNNLGQYWYAKKDFHQAKADYLEAISNFKASLGEKHPYIATVLVNVASQFQNLKQYDSALYYYDQAEQLQKSIYPELHKNFALVATNRAEMFFEIGDQEKGHYYNKQTQEILEALYEIHPYLARSFSNGAWIYFKNGDLDKALEHVQKSLITNALEFRDMSYEANPTLTDWLDPYRVINSLILKGKILFAQAIRDENPQLLTATMEVLDLADQMVNKTFSFHLNHSERIKLAELSQDLYQFAVKTCYQQLQKENTEEWKSLLFKYMERSKAAVLTLSLMDRGAKIAASVPIELIDFEESLKVKQSLYRSNILRMKAEKSADSTELTAIEQELFGINRSLDSVMTIFNEAHPEYFQLKYERDLIELSTVQKKLSDQRAIIDYFVGPDSIYVMSIMQNTVSATVIPKGESWQTNVQQLSRDFKEPYFSKQQASRSYNFYKGVISPALQPLDDKINQLTIITHGELSLIPFDALTINLGDSVSMQDRFLISKYAIAYGQSATLTFRPANLEFSKGDDALSYAPVYTESNFESDKNLVSRAATNLAPLKWNRQEASSISDYLSGKAILGEKATETAFKNTAQSGRILHLAMHAFVDHDNPMDSKLVFYQNKDSIEDNMLHTFEIFNMRLNAELAVLSACNTGVGEIQAGEGVMSLARAFAYAGVPSLVMSHWNVNDESTSKLMTTFYRYLADGEPKDNALRKAKLDFLAEANEIQASPYFWGGFVLVGDNSPIDLEKNYYWWLLLIIPALGLFRLSRKKQ